MCLIATEYVETVLIALPSEIPAQVRIDDPGIPAVAELAGIVTLRCALPAAPVLVRFGLERTRHAVAIHDLRTGTVPFTKVVAVVHKIGAITGPYPVSRVALKEVIKLSINA